MYRHALRLAASLPVSAAMVEACLSLDHPVDRLFHTAWTQSLDPLPLSHRTGALSGITGHIAESVLQTMFVEAGFVHLPATAYRLVEVRRLS